MKILHNTRPYAPGFPGATALALSQGQIVALGTDPEILDAFPLAEEKVDLRGCTLWPGLTDAHVHLRHLAESRAIVDCETATRAECLERIAAAARELPPGAWVRGHGWNHNQWPEGLGTAELLDRVSHGHPAYLSAKSLHIGWANSLALALAGLTDSTPDPESGILQRDAQGRLTGILYEAEAVNLILGVIPELTPEVLKQQIQSLIPELWSLGLVGAHDFDGFDCWLALQSLHQQGELKFRIRKSVPYDHLDDFIQAGLRTNSGDDFLQIGSVKLFSDGALGSQTAAMLAPYEGSQSTGALLLTEDEILEIGRKTGSNGLSLAIHAIGDRANQVVLNAYAKLRVFEGENRLPRFKHRIEHVQILAKEDLPRLAELGIVASVQPVHAPSDRDMADKFLGQRAEWAYAYQALKRTGAEMAFGSDAPVEPVNPFHGLHAAVTRRRLDGSPGPEGWHPQERLALAEALDGFSWASARISSRGGRLGRIAPGAAADLILLKTDPFTLDPQDIGALKPLATMVAGEWVFQHPEMGIGI